MGPRSPFLSHSGLLLRHRIDTASQPIPDLMPPSCRSLCRSAAILYGENKMQARMKNPAVVVPDVMQPLIALSSAAKKDVPARILWLVLIRASQINGCTWCVDHHCKEAKKDGDSDER